MLSFTVVALYNNMNKRHFREKSIRRTLQVVLLLSAVMLLRLCNSNTVSAQYSRGNSELVKVEEGLEYSPYAESHALVIGVSDYNNGWKPLPGVLTDVKEVSRVLESQGFKVNSLLNPTVEKLWAALREFKSRYGLRYENRLLIYFAGHGYTEKSGGRELGYIVMHDAPLPRSNPQGFSLTSVVFAEVKAYAWSLKSKHALFIFDSCFAGNIHDNPITNSKYILAGNSNAQLAMISLASLPVRMFITAGNSEQETPDDSLFRRYFVRAFEQREGDLDGNGYITGSELGQYLTGNVIAISNQKLTPVIGKMTESEFNLGDMVFILPKNTKANLSLLTFDSSPLEILLWQAAERDDEIKGYEEYLRQYSEGRFAVNAKIRIAKLRGRSNEEKK